MTASTRVEPAFCSFPPFDRTLGPEVADLCDAVGYGPDADQRFVLDVIFGLNPAGLAAAYEVAVICSRQNLKTAIFKMCTLGWLFITDQRLVVWSAHEFSTAQEAFRDLEVLVTGSDVLRRRVKAIHRGNGEEAIELVGDRRLKFKARTKSGGRGLTGDKIVLDEAFALQPTHMGALMPTLLAVPDPQVVYGSSAGRPESDVLRSVRDRGRPGSDPRLAYVEWCDDLPGTCELGSTCNHALTAPGCRLDDEARWARSNPALGRRITAESVRAQRRMLPPAEFARELLSWWDEPPGGVVIAEVDWLRCEDPTSALVGRPVFAIDVAPNSRSAAVVAAGLNAKRLPHAEVVEHLPGTDWVVDWCEERQKHSPHGWILDPNGPAGALKPDLERAGIELTEITARELGQACEDLTAKATDGGFAHLPDDRLTRAIEGASRQDVGDGLWKWSRKRSDADICPLVAFTEALWGLSRFRVGEYDLMNSVHVG